MGDKKGRELILAGIVVAMLYWFFQVCFDVFIISNGSLVRQVRAPTMNELWMRLFVVGTIILVGVYAQRIINERNQAGKRLEHLTLMLRAISNVNQLITKEKDRNRLLKGVCDNLTETHVYYNAWIALLDESVGLIATAEAGLGSAFFPMVEQLMRGELPKCGQRALKQSGMVVIENPLSFCYRCPLASMYYGRGEMAVRLEYNGQTYGLLVVSTPRGSALDEEEQALLEEVARNIASTLYNIELEEERQLTEVALRQSEAKNRALLNAVPDVMYRISQDSTFLEFKAAKGDASYTPPIEFIGRKIDEMLPAEVAKAATHSVEQVRQTGEVQIFEYQLPVGDDMHSYEARATASGQDEVLLMVRDITERKQAEEAVRESEQKFRELADLLPQTVFELDMLGNFTFANRQAFESSGYTPEDIAGGLNALQLFIPEDRDRVRENMKRRLSGEEFGTTEYTELRKDGSTFPVLVHSAPVIREDKPVGLRGVIIDITERKQAEEAVQKHAHDLGKRVKELDCLYGASRLMAELDRPADKVFQEVVGFIPRSWQYPEITCARIIFRGQQFKTDNFKETAWQQSADVMVFREKAGSVEVHYLQEKPNADEGPFLKEERALLDALAREVGDFVERQRVEEMLLRHTHDLSKRVRELDCLHGALKLMTEPDRSMEEVFREIVGLIPPSWRYPDIACARIIFRGQQFKTDNFEETAWRQSADVMVFGEKAGSVEVHYLREKPNVDEGPFLKEERALLDALAREIGKFIERQGMGEEIRKHRDHLEEVVAERTAELAKTNEELQTEIVERQRAEVAQREERDRAQGYLDVAGVMLVVFGADQKVKLINKKGCEVLGYKEDKIIDKNWFDNFLPKEIRSEVKVVFDKLMAGEIEPVEYLENAVLTKSGEKRIVAWHNAVLRGAAGNIVGILSSGEDITERKRAEEALQKSEERQRAVLQTAKDGIISIDSLGDIISWDGGAQDIFGYTEEEVLGKKMTILMPEQYRDFFLKGMETFSSREGPGNAGRRYELIGLRKDGREFPADVSIASWTTNKGTFHTSIVRDITERKQAEEAQREAKEAAEAANQAKGEFLARMSHEVRTPIHGIMGMLELVQDTRLSPEQRDYLGIASTSAESLLNIINSILDFSKIGAGKLERENTDFDLRAALEYTVEAQALIAHRKGLDLSCHLPPEIPTALVGDMGHLRQVLLNLIHNAVKFTEQGEVTVRVAMAVERKQAVKLHFAVHDTGIGIPEDKLKLIFEAFHQADGSASRQYDGTGLGLAISKQLVELMGGRLQAESRIGEGSVFHFTLKFKKQAHAGTPVAPPEAMADWRGLPVLVVDDNETNRLILREMLGYWGFKVTEAVDGPTGLRELKKAKKASRHFRLVLLDKTVPEMDSYDMVRRIPDDLALKDTIVMMLPSGNVPGDAGRCRELGISYLVKPIRQSALLGSVRMALGAVPDEAEKAKEPEPVASDLAAGSRWRILLAEDNTASQMIVRGGLEKKGHLVLVANNGLEVLRVLEKEDFDLILMDMEMPQMDGLEATRTIRRREAKTGQHIPILAMTAYAMEEDKQRCLEAGMDGYVSKPVTYKKLYRIIEDLLSPDGKYESAPPVDVATALELVDGDEELLQAAVRMFLEEDCPRQMEMLRAGLEQQDARAVKEAAHGIKGAASNLGGQAVNAVALRLETIGREGDLAGTDGLLGELEAELARFAAFFSGCDLACSRKGPSAG